MHGFAGQYRIARGWLAGFVVDHRHAAGALVDAVNAAVDTQLRIERPFRLELDTAQLPVALALDFPVQVIRQYAAPLLQPAACLEVVLDGILEDYIADTLLAFTRKLGRDNRYILYLFIYSIVFFAMTFFTTDLVIRYILPVLPPLVIIAVFGIRASIERGGAARYIALAGLLLYFLISVLYLNGLYARYAPLSYLTGSQSRAEYLLAMLPDYETTAYANANIAKDSKVLFLFTGERAYYWKRDYFYGGRLGENLLAQVKRAGSAEELLTDMRGRGYTHLFIMDPIFDRFAADNFTASEQDLLRDFFGKYLRRLHSANGFTLYRLSAAAQAR